jgi:hypothetical protein
VEAGAAVPPARINNRCSNASEVMLGQIHEALEFLQEPRRQYRVEGIPAAGVPKPSLERAATAGYFDDRQRNKTTYRSAYRVCYAGVLWPEIGLNHFRRRTSFPSQPRTTTCTSVPSLN